MTADVDERFLRGQQEKLEAEVRRLEADLTRFAKKDPVGEDYHARVEQVGRKEEDNVVEEEQYAADRSVEQTLEVHLREVKAALQRIADGTYGQCVRCRQPISRERLGAEPAAATCVEHAQ